MSCLFLHYLVDFVVDLVGWRL